MKRCSISNDLLDDIINCYINLDYQEILSCDDISLLLSKKLNIQNKKNICKKVIDCVKKSIEIFLNKDLKLKIKYKNIVYSPSDYYYTNETNIDIKMNFLFKILHKKVEYKKIFKEELDKKFEFKSNPLIVFCKGLSFVFSFIFVFFLTVVFSLCIICYGPSEKAKNIFVTTFLETGALKKVPNLFLSESEINSIVSMNALQEMNEDVDVSKIEVSNENNIEIEKIYGNNYFATMLIVHEPSKIKLATTYPFSEYGKNLDEIVKINDAIAGVNGGLYESIGNKGGYPEGVVVSEGKILFNKPYGKGYHLVGFDNNNILRIINISNLNASGVKQLVEKEQIRDAVTFQEEYSDSNNHFVKLIINGESRKMNGLGSGANPRTAIGQREDGTVLFLVTDGRGTSGHLGATASDLIEVMQKYGAVNAANIDGGSSSAMFYNGEYLMTSVTLYYNNSSWRLPDAFIISK